MYALLWHGYYTTTKWCKSTLSKRLSEFLSSTSVKFVLNNNLVVVYETGKCDVLC
jgi:hypothetical protein